MISERSNCFNFYLQRMLACTLRRTPALLLILMLPPLAHAQVGTFQFTGAVVTLSHELVGGPTGVAVDGSGNVYFVESKEVKELLAASNYATVKTIASGFSQPWGIAVDSSENVYVADQGTPNGSSEGTPGSGKVYKVLAAESYATLNTLGSGFNHPSGIAVDSDGNVFVTDTGNNAVYEILAVGGYTTVNTLGTGFNYPTDLAVDKTGNIFVADDGNGAVKEILATGGYATVNTLLKGLTFPVGVAVDADGDLFIADDGNAVQEILAFNGTIPQNNPTIYTLGGGLFDMPQGAAVNSAGSIFVADGSSVQEIYTSSLVNVPISPGGKVNYTFMLNPIAPANTFPAAITFSASGGPTGATYTFLPATIAQGSGATSVILTVSVPSATTANLTEPWTTPSQAVSRYIPGHLRFNYNSKLSLLALFMLPLAGKFRKAGRRFYKVTPTILLLFSCVAIGASICSCGGSSNSSTTSKQASGNYTITVTASSGANTQSTTFGLKVN